MKKIFIMIMCFMFTIVASAQNVQKFNYENVGAFGLPYVSINGGVMTPLGQVQKPVAEGTEPAEQQSFLNGLRPTVGVEFGTYVTPVWGFSVTGHAAFCTTDSPTIVDNTNVVMNGKINLSNLLAGYKGYPRRIEFVAVPGIGWGHEFGDEPYDKNFLTYNLGGELNLNLRKERDWQITIRPSVSWATFDSHLPMDQRNATGVLTIGVVKKFYNKRVNSHNFVTNNYAVTQYDYDILKAKYEELLDHVNVAASKEEKVKTVVETKIVKDTVTVDIPDGTTIYFQKGKYTLSDWEKFHLEQLCENLKALDVKKIKITGSADSKTGSTKRNEFLARKRAEAVKDFIMTHYSINENDIVIESYLDVFDTPERSRVAIVE